jgi:hypothetical protein
MVGNPFTIPFLFKLNGFPDECPHTLRAATRGSGSGLTVYGLGTTPDCWRSSTISQTHPRALRKRQLPEPQGKLTFGEGPPRVWRGMIRWGVAPKT